MANPDFTYDHEGRQVSLALANRSVWPHGPTLYDYVRSAAGQGGLSVTPDIEWVLMSGGCAAYALAFLEQNPHCVLTTDTDYDLSAAEPTEMIDHVFCVDPETGRAYDIRGEFESA